MIKEALQYIVGIGEPRYHTLSSGHEFSDKALYPVKAGAPAPVLVHTLSGLLGLIQAGIDTFVPEEVGVHVEDHETVHLVSLKSGLWDRRLYATARLIKVNSFPFGQFVDPETFLIAAQSGFVDSGDLQYILQRASKVTTERITTSEDDGVAQRIGQQKGVALKTIETLKAKVLVSPYRTFTEVNQVAIQCVFRARQTGDGLPTLALFEADGGAWKVDAMKAVADYLRGKLGQDGQASILVVA